MPKGIPLTEEELERRRKQILGASIDLILEQGFNETSMRQIAAAAGVGKSTLYDYFKSKDEILISYFENEIEAITGRALAIANQDQSMTDKLTKIMQMHLAYLVDNKHLYLKLSIESARLAQASQQKIQVKRHAYQDLLRALVEEGIRQGEFRSVDPLFAARSIFMLLTNAVFTSRPTGTPEEMLAEAQGIFFRGVQA